MIRAGFSNRKIPDANIVAVRPSSDSRSALAMSLDRVQIVYGPSSEILIAQIIRSFSLRKWRVTRHNCKNEGRIWSSLLPEQASLISATAIKKGRHPANRARPTPSKTRKLFLFDLLLLTDADLKHCGLRILKSFMIMPGDGFSQVRIHVRFTGKHGHNSKTVVAGGAERAETLYIRDCHSKNSLANRQPDRPATFTAASR
jgi:hypothetical protein